MGCDIHFEVEIKTHKGWQPVPTDVEGHRDYLCFGILAGVCNHDVAPIAEPKGHRGIGLEDPPKPNASYWDEVPHKYNWGFGYHSHSWLNLSELLGYDWNQEYGDDDSERDGLKDTWVYKSLIPTMQLIARERGLLPEEIRIVFCFDS